jgi:AbiV family abortive infection protein
MTEISLEQLLEGRSKAIKNAGDLIKDAEVLYANQRWARSVFISSIAIEELGKYLMIIGAIGETMNNNINWKKFWKRFRDHSEKKLNILTFDIILGPFVSDELIANKLRKIEVDAKQMESEKFAALYVDIVHEKFVCPMEIVDQKAALASLETAKSVYDFFDQQEQLIYSKMDINKFDKNKFNASKSEWLKMARNPVED